MVSRRRQAGRRRLTLRQRFASRPAGTLKVKLTVRRRGETLDVELALVGAADFYGEACERGDGLACQLLGTLHELGGGMPRDPQAAAGLYEKACTAGCTPKAARTSGCCSWTATAWQWTRRAPAAALRPSCEGGSAASCADLAWVYAEGRGVPRTTGGPPGLYAALLRRRQPRGLLQRGPRLREGAHGKIS